MIYRIKRYARQLLCGIRGHKWEVIKGVHVIWEEVPNAHLTISRCQCCGVTQYNVPLGLLCTVTMKKRSKQLKEAVTDSHPFLEMIKRSGGARTREGGRTITESMDYRDKENE